MLQRSTQVGEFYRMSPPAAWDTSKKLPKAYMDIVSCAPRRAAPLGLR